ncbi:MAG: ribosome silencing factor [Gammaproteobacteria bacterium]
MTEEELKRIVIDAIEDMKAQDIKIIDVRGRTSVTDLMIVVSGTSARHVKSIAGNIVKEAKEKGVPPLGTEGEDQGEWILVDLGDIVIHVMLPKVRLFYQIEQLWEQSSEGSAEQAH